MDNKIIKVDDNTIDYYGYLVSTDGEIYRKDKLTGEYHKLSSYCFTYPGSHVSMWIDGKHKKVMKAKLIYELFSGEKLDRSVVLQFKDGDRENCAFENMYVITRKEFFQEIGDYNQQKFDNATRKEIKKIYSKKRPIKMPDGHKRYPSVRNLCILYGCSLKLMQRTLKDEGKEKQVRCSV